MKKEEDAARDVVRICLDKRAKDIATSGWVRADDVLQAGRPAYGFSLKRRRLIVKA